MDTTTNNVMSINSDECLFANNVSLLISNATQNTAHLGAEIVPPTTNSIVVGLAECAKNLKNKEHPVAIVIRDNIMNGAFLFAVVIKFIEGKEKDSGSWNTIWTFNEADIEDCEKWYMDDLTKPMHLTLEAQFIKDRLMVNKDSSIYWKLCKYIFEGIREWLDQNAKPGEQVKLISEGVFEATVDVIDDIKVMNFIPDEEVTNVAKSDAQIS